MKNETYVVATIRPWNVKIYHETIRRRPGKWHLITAPQQLTEKSLKALNPRYIFFPHWGYKVPAEIIRKYECVCFHMTDVPYGRGGSPLQNLIVRGKKRTKISALRMTDKFDAGPVYLKRPLALDGRAEEIFIRAAKIVAAMIAEIIRKKPVPVPQKGKPVVFKRRTPRQSAVPTEITALDKLFDHIRMLDAEGYPRAFIEQGAFCYEFFQPINKKGCIIAQVKIARLQKGKKR